MAEDRRDAGADEKRRAEARGAEGSREARLKAALKANMGRRKAQARDRSAAAGRGDEEGSS